jgi:hypothetical protein
MIANCVVLDQYISATYYSARESSNTLPDTVASPDALSAPLYGLQPRVFALNGEIFVPVPSPHSTAFLDGLRAIHAPYQLRTHNAPGTLQVITGRVGQRNFITPITLNIGLKKRRETAKGINHPKRCVKSQCACRAVGA